MNHAGLVVRELGERTRSRSALGLFSFLLASARRILIGSGVWTSPSILGQDDEDQAMHAVTIPPARRASQRIDVVSQMSYIEG